MLELIPIKVYTRFSVTTGLCVDEVATHDKRDI